MLSLQKATERVVPRPEALKWKASKSARRDVLSLRKSFSASAKANVGGGHGDTPSTGGPRRMRAGPQARKGDWKG